MEALLRDLEEYRGGETDDGQDAITTRVLWLRNGL